MFEYIKRVSIVLGFLAKKVSSSNKNLSEVFLRESLELLKSSQKFRGENFETQDLINLKNQILFLIDMIDYAHVDNSISTMNAEIFKSSYLTFYKHILHLINQGGEMENATKDLQTETEIFTRQNVKNNECE